MTLAPSLPCSPATDSDDLFARAVTSSAVVQALKSHPFTEVVSADSLLSGEDELDNASKPIVTYVSLNDIPDPLESFIDHYADDSLFDRENSDDSLLSTYAAAKYLQPKGIHFKPTVRVIYYHTAGNVNEDETDIIINSGAYADSDDDEKPSTSMVTVPFECPLETASRAFRPAIKFSIGLDSDEDIADTDLLYSHF